MKKGNQDEDTSTTYTVDVVYMLLLFIWIHHVCLHFMFISILVYVPFISCPSSTVAHGT